MHALFSYDFLTLVFSYCQVLVAMTVQMFKLFMNMGVYINILLS